MKRFNSTWWTVGLTALALGISVDAQAQEAGVDTARDPGDIIVTANKREESLNDVGLSITAIGSEALRARRITSVEDVAASVPGLKFAESGASTPIYTLRGVGFNESSLGVYPSVSVYLDQMPLPFPILGLHAAFDLQRIEVLKGPQGTLFGENATGGAINYVAAKPTDTLKFGGDLSYGRFNQIDGNAYISGPLGAGLSGRLAVTGLDRDGWQKSLSRPGDKNGRVKYLAGRASLAYEGPGVDVLATVNAWSDNSQPLAAQLVGIRPQIPAFVPQEELSLSLAGENARLADWSLTSINGNVRPRSDRDYIQAGLSVGMDVGTFARITSLTSYQSMKSTDFIDLDGSAIQLSNIGPVLGKVDSFSQELRIENQGASELKWVLGANFESSKTSEDQTLSYEDSSQHNPTVLFIDGEGVRAKQKFRNYAFFGNVEYSVTEALTLKGGLRYTQARDKVAICGYVQGQQVADLFNFLVPNVLAPGLPYDPIGVGDCYPVNEQGQSGDVFYDTLKENNVSWLAGADYHVNDDLMVYANVSRGFKAGSYPTIHASSFVSYQPVTQESVTSYEAGFKGTFLDRLVSLNAAAFYYDYKDKQVRGKLVDPIFDILDALVNVPKSRIMGLEGDISIRPAKGLTLGASATYLDSKIRIEPPGPNVYGLTQDFNGTELPFTPKWSWSINADWRHEMADNSAIFAGAYVRGQSSSIAQLGGRSITFEPLALTHIDSTDLPFVLPAYATVDARLGYQFAHGGPSVSVWGKNIFNKYYVTNANQYLDATVRFAGTPATYGVTVSFGY